MLCDIVSRPLKRKLMPGCPASERERDEFIDNQQVKTDAPFSYDAGSRHKRTEGSRHKRTEGTRHKRTEGLLKEGTLETDVWMPGCPYPYTRITHTPMRVCDR